MSHKSFIQSNPVTTLDYQYWLNRRIYHSKTKMNNPFWMKEWDIFFEDPNQDYLFREFLSTKMGQKWLTSELGKMYIQWQKG